jgi:hypothetical protein
MSRMEAGRVGIKCLVRGRTGLSVLAECYGHLTSVPVVWLNVKPLRWEAGIWPRDPLTSGWPLASGFWLLTSGWPPASGL